MSSTLYIIATPIGNRLDITLRALECLRELTVLFAEDTRQLRKLLALEGLSVDGKRLSSLSLHNMKVAVLSAINSLDAGQDVGYVSDRGTPGVSDPGRLLVEKVIAAGHLVRPLPGPSALTALVSSSYLVEKEFIFIGFLPQGNSERQQCFEKLAQCDYPFVFYEAARRVTVSLSDVQGAFPNAEIHIGRELTKKFEAHHYLQPGQQYYGELQGEFAILVKPNVARLTQESASLIDVVVAERLMADKQWARSVAGRTGVSARQLYNQLVRLRKDVDAEG